MTNKFTLNKNEEGRFELHQSGIKEWKRCRLKAYWSSRNGKSLTPKRDQKHLWFGTGIHLALEYYYEKDLDPVKVWKHWCDFEEEWIKENSRKYGADEDSLEEDRKLGRKMLDYYKQYDPDKKIHTKNNEFEVIETEVKFRVPIPTHNGNKSQCDYVGRADAVLKDKYGRLFGGEHKSWSNLDMSHLDMDTQAGLYTWGLSQEYGEKFEGILYNCLRKAVPQEPDVNKSGSISRRKKKALTRELYEAKIEDQGLDKDDYQDILKWIDKNGYEFIKRKPIRRNDKELDVIQHMLYTTYKSIHNSEIFPEPQKRFGSMCGDCDFKGPCKLLMEGRDPSRTLERKYEKRDAHDKEEKFEDYLSDKLQEAE